MVGSGDLDRRIIIERSHVTFNELNEPVETWLPFLSIWARRRDVSDGERLAAGQVGSSLSSRFLIRSSTDARTVTPIDRISHEGAIWSIHGIKEADEGRLRFLEITAAKDADG